MEKERPLGHLGPFGDEERRPAKVLIRCMGRCSHRPGTCTATSGVEAAVEHLPSTVPVQPELPLSAAVPLFKLTYRGAGKGKLRPTEISYLIDPCDLEPGELAALKALGRQPSFSFDRAAPDKLPPPSEDYSMIADVERCQEEERKSGRQSFYRGGCFRRR